jgi:hypothetical protein
MDYYDAEKAVKGAAIITIIIFFISLLKIFFTLMAGTEQNATTFLSNPWNYLDYLFLIVGAVMLLRYSRAAAVLLFLYYLFSKVVQFSSIESSATMIVGGIISLLFIYFYVQGIRGAYAYHRLKKAENPEYQAAAKWTYYTGIPLAVIIAILLIIGTLSETGVIAPIEVVSGDKVSAENVKLLIKERIITPNETIKLFYSSGLSSIIEEGNILTDQRVVSYEVVDGKMDVYNAKFADIENVTIIKPGTTLEDTIVEVTHKNGSFYLLLSNENHGDQRFVDEIENIIYQDGR